jgi:hypothetical protein
MLIRDIVRSRGMSTVEGRTHVIVHGITDMNDFHVLQALCMFSYYLLHMFSTHNIIIIVIIIIIITTQSVLRQIHSLVQNEFSTEGDLVLPLSIFSILFFPLR